VHLETVTFVKTGGAVFLFSFGSTTGSLIPETSFSGDFNSNASLNVFMRFEEKS
jgi:hypothetical protein